MNFDDGHMVDHMPVFQGDIPTIRQSMGRVSGIPRIDGPPTLSAPVSRPAAPIAPFRSRGLPTRTIIPPGSNYGLGF